MGNSARDSLERALRHPDFVDLTHLDNVRVDLRYGTTNNLLGRDVYGGFQRVVLHQMAGEKFRNASDLLRREHPALRFLVFDALRPQAAQLEFWGLVKGTPQQAYFADPAKGSIHSYGFAIDLGLADEAGRELDMGTEFDDLSEKAEPRRETELLAKGALTETQVSHRKILRELMVRAGFLSIPHEWWHFDALLPTEVRASFRRVE
jgi:D-alanyl-D-alanine dipeptidase